MHLDDSSRFERERKSFEQEFPSSRIQQMQSKLESHRLQIEQMDVQTAFRENEKGDDDELKEMLESPD